MTQVPHQGASPALQDLMAGHLDFMGDVVASSLPFVCEGTLRALASVGGEQRLQVLPQMPTLTAAGYADLDIPGWNGVMVRAGTPAPGAPAAFGELISSESQRWSLATRQTGIKIE